LVVTGLKDPRAITVDQRNLRLYVSDPASGTVFWYQLEVELPSKMLITDGVQRIAAANMAAKGLAVNQAGDLYMTGLNIAVGDVPAATAVFHKDSVSIVTESKGFDGLSRLWTAGDGSWAPVGTGFSTPTTPELYQPGPIDVDLFGMYWGNNIRGPTASAIARGALTVPAPATGSESKAPQPTATALADNLESVSGLAVTSSGVYYCGRKGTFGLIYGVPRKDTIHGCQAEGSKCSVIAEVTKPSSLAWDGESTMYVADAGTGNVFSFASDVVGRHELVRVGEAKGVESIAILRVRSSCSQLAVSALTVLACLLSNLRSI